MANRDERLGGVSGLWGETRRLELLAVALGATWTLALFGGIAHLERTPAPVTTDEFEELHAVVAPLDLPPPRPEQPGEPGEAPVALAGLDPGASDSPVKIAVVPPDLAAFLPSSAHAPTARIQTTQLYTEFKPRRSMDEELSQRVYQKNEVDRPPTVSFRPFPDVPEIVRKNADQLRVVAIVIVDHRGGVAGVRVLKSSGNPEFDAIVAQSIRDEWTFTPAVKNGKRVKCLVEQPVTVRWNAGSPFTL